MRDHQAILTAVLGLALLGACELATSAREDSPLAGRWATASEALNPRGSYQSFLTFEDTTFVSEVRNYGLYAGQHPNELSAYSRFEGTFLVEGDSLQLSATHLVTWDGFFGPNPAERTELPPSQGPASSRAHFAIDQDRLTLRYYSYPADGPVATSRTYWRLPGLLQN